MCNIITGNIAGISWTTMRVLSEAHRETVAGARMESMLPNIPTKIAHFHKELMHQQALSFQTSRIRLWHLPADSPSNKRVWP
jgi:hypothetical protein